MFVYMYIYDCMTKPLFQAMKIEAIGQLYAKHKIFFLKQIKDNSETQQNVRVSIQGHYENVQSTCRFPDKTDKSR